MTGKKTNENRRARALSRASLGALAALALIFALAAGAFSFAAPAAAATDRQVDKEVWTMRDMYVRLEAQDKYKGAPPPPNQHPINIAQDQLYNALSQITIKPEDNGDYLPLFTEFELGVLSKNVAAALAEAGPTQDVTFAVIGWHKGAGLFSLSTEQLTTGRVFYQNGQVNLILGEAHRPVQMGDNYATSGVGADRRLDPFVPGMRGFTQRHKWKLAALPKSGVYSAPGGARNDWLVFSAQALAAPPPPAPGRPGAPSAAEQARYDALNKQVQQLQQQLQQLQQSRGVAPAATYPAQPAAPGYPAPYPPQPAYPGYPGYQPPAYPAPPQAQVPGESPSGGTSVQQRLLVLDDLKNKGLISDEEYQERRNHILSGQ